MKQERYEDDDAPMHTVAAYRFALEQGGAEVKIMTERNDDDEPGLKTVDIDLLYGSNIAINRDEVRLLQLWRKIVNDSDDLEIGDDPHLARLANALTEYKQRE